MSHVVPADRYVYAVVHLPIYNTQSQDYRNINIVLDMILYYKEVKITKSVNYAFGVSIIILIVVSGSGFSCSSQIADEISDSNIQAITIRNVGDFESVTDNSLVVIESEEELIESPVLVQKINELASEGNIIVSESKVAMSYIDEGMSHVFSTSPSVDCFYYDDDTGVSIV